MDRYPEHEPISITADEQLYVPDAVSGNGVRRGTGTPDDPFVIENWTIPYDPQDTHAITISGTTDHVVVQNIRFVYEGEKRGHFFLGDVSNVTIRNLHLEGPRRADRPLSPGVFNGLRDARLENITIQGNLSLGVTGSTHVRIQNINISGPDGGLGVVSGTYSLRNVTIDNDPSRWDDSGGGVFTIWRLEGSYEDQPCEVDVKGLEVREAKFTGIRVGGKPGCSVRMREVTVSATGPAIQIVNQSVRARDLAARKHPYPPSSRGEAALTVHENGAFDATNVSIAGYQGGIALGGGAKFLRSDPILRDAHSPPTPATLRLRESTLRPEGISILVFGECPDCTVRNTSLLSRGPLEVVNRGPSTLDARHNWWGSPDGPADGAVEGDVLVAPWKTQGPGAESDHGLPGASAAAAIVAVGVAAVAWAGRRSKGG